MANLLLISCSGTKKQTPGALPALERYDGTTYKVIKKAKREGYWPEDTDIFIISAKYGLISEYTAIEDYDQKMTPARALELQSEVSRALDSLLQEKNYQNIFINMGMTYTASLDHSSEIQQARQNHKLQEAAGGIGERLQQTKAWLIQAAKNENR